MPKIYVCETCGRDVDELGFDRYRFQKTTEEVEEVKAHLAAMPDHLICELVILNG